MVSPDARRRRGHRPVRRRRTWRRRRESRSKYYTGEAYWALARLHLLFPDDGFGAVADRIGNYLATQRDDVEGHWPPIPDHWVAYGLSETVTFPERDDRQPLTDAELDYARRQAGLFGGPGALGQPAGRAVGSSSCAARRCRAAAGTASSARP